MPELHRRDIIIQISRKETEFKHHYDIGLYILIILLILLAKDFCFEISLVKWSSYNYPIVKIHGRQWIIIYRCHSRQKEKYIPMIYLSNKTYVVAKMVPY